MLHYVIRDGHLVDRRRVRSPGLAIMIRPDLAERERRRGEPPNPMPLPSRKAGSPLPKSDGRSWARNPVAATANPAPNACDRNDGSPLPSASVAPQPSVEVEYFSHSSPFSGSLASERNVVTGGTIDLHEVASGRDPRYAPGTGVALRRLREEAASGSVPALVKEATGETVH